MADVFEREYCVTVEREHHPAIGDKITFIMLPNGRPIPLADGGTNRFYTDKKCFEVPVFITDNSRRKFEGVLTGIADGEDITLRWAPERDTKTLGRITATTNSTVTFLERKGATRW